MNLRSQDIDVFLPDDSLTLSIERNGYWFGQEVIELIRFMNGGKWNRVADLGCGDGVIPLLLGSRRMADEIWAIDIDADHCRRTETNIDRNHLTGQIRVLNHNIRSLHGILKKHSFDLITANPPFFSAGKDHQNQAESEQNARQEIHGALKHFLQAADYLASRKADVFLIYHPSRLDRLFEELNRTRFRCKNLQFLHHEDGRALFTLCHATSHGKPGIILRAPVVLKKSLKQTFSKES